MGYEERYLVRRRLQNLLVVLRQLIVRRCERVEVSTERSNADDIQGGFVRPLVNLHFLVPLRFSCHAFLHLHRLRQEEGVEFLDVAEAEGRRGMLALELVLITFHDDQAVAQHDA